jgi:hypothetical protein
MWFYPPSKQIPEEPFSPYANLKPVTLFRPAANAGNGGRMLDP